MPFVANLSKLYDEDTLNSIYDNYPLQSRKNEYLYGNPQEIARDYIRRNHDKKPENRGNHFDSNSVSDGKALVDKSGLNVDKNPKKCKNLDDEVFEDMQRQMHIGDALKSKSIGEMTEEDLDRIITPQHKESIRKIEELLDN